MQTNKTRTVLLSTLVVGLLLAGGLTYAFMAGRSEDGLVSGEEFAPDQLNEGGLDDIATLSLPDAQKRLNFLIADTRDSLNALNRLSSLTLKITPVTATPVDQVAVVPAYDELIKPFTGKDVEAALAALAPGAVDFRQVIDVPGSVAKWNTQALDAIWKQAAAASNESVERYRFKRVYFRDGSEQDYSAVQARAQADDEETGYYSSDAELNTAKPIDKVSVEVSYKSYPGYHKVVLDKDHPQVTVGSERYRLTSLQDNAAALMISTPRADSFAVQGLDESGRRLRSSSSNSSTLPSDEEMASLRKLYDALLKVKANFSQYRDSQSLQDELQKLAVSLQPAAGSLKNIQAQYRYDDTPARVEIVVYDPVQVSKTELMLSNRVPVQDIYIAHDQKTDLVGFVDASGAWKIKPTFIGIDYLDIASVYRVVTGKRSINDEVSEILVKYYYLQPGTLNFKVLPFEGIEEQINDDLMLVQRNTNGPYGIYSMKKQAFTVPMKFVNAKVQDNIMVARLGDKTYEAKPTYGAFTLDGKEILPPRFGGVRQYEGFLYTTSADDKRHDLYDLSGNKINPAGFDVLGDFAAGQPLLIQNSKTRAFAFIDQQGKSLPFKLPYDEVQPFSNGMAVVRKGERYGAIDMQGALSVPLNYLSIRPFQARLAAAVPEEGFDGLVLIDKHNQLVKKLGGYNTYSVSANNNDAQYSIYDPEKEGRILVYDADGQQINSYEIETDSSSEGDSDEAEQATDAVRAE
jgi:hypothetical protein